jgi:hypothetical protein
VIARQDNLLCGPTYKNYENKAAEITQADIKPPEKPIENKKYEYDNSYDYIMSQIHI